MEKMQWIALGFLIACVAVELSILVIGPGADLLRYLKEKVMASRCGRQTTIDFASIVRAGSSFDPQKSGDLDLRRPIEEQKHTNPAPQMQYLKVQKVKPCTNWQKEHPVLTGRDGRQTRKCTLNSQSMPSTFRRSKHHLWLSSAQPGWSKKIQRPRQRRPVRCV